jgi:energy-coupling factor transporter ATP-binding protein EcfA2
MSAIYFISGNRAAGKSILAVILEGYLKSQEQRVITTNTDSVSEVCELDSLLEMTEEANHLIVEVNEFAKSPLIEWINGVLEELESHNISHWFLSDLSRKSWHGYGKSLGLWMELNIQSNNCLVLNNYYRDQIEEGALPLNTREVCSSTGTKILLLPGCEVRLARGLGLEEIAKNLGFMDRSKFIDWQQAAYGEISRSGLLPKSRSIMENPILGDLLTGVLGRKPVESKEIEDAPW